MATIYPELYGDVIKHMYTLTTAHDIIPHVTRTHNDVDLFVSGPRPDQTLVGS